MQWLSQRRDKTFSISSIDLYTVANNARLVACSRTRLKICCILSRAFMSFRNKHVMISACGKRTLTPYRAPPINENNIAWSSSFHFNMAICSHRDVWLLCDVRCSMCAVVWWEFYYSYRFWIGHFSPIDTVLTVISTSVLGGTTKPAAATRRRFARSTSTGKRCQRQNEIAKYGKIAVKKVNAGTIRWAVPITTAEFIPRMLKVSCFIPNQSHRLFQQKLSVSLYY